MRKALTCMVAAAMLSGCGVETDRSAAIEAPVDLAAEADRIARSSIIVDTHIDVPMRLVALQVDVSQALDAGDFDYPRALAGGLNAPFMSIYTPADYEALGKSKAAAEKLIDAVEDLVAKAPDKYAIATSVDDVRQQFAAGLISLPMGMENGSPVEGDISNLQHFYARGIRYLSLSHGSTNHLSDSSYDENHQWDGISEFGADVIREMNRLGIMIDVSHVSDAAFWQILEITGTPVIASHSSARHFTPGFERNMSDEMIVALAGNGGVIHINFGSMFVTQEARAYSEARSVAGKAYKEEHPEATEAFLWQEFPRIYANENGPMPYASLDDVLDHFDHVVALVGVDHVGIGSDYDGVGDALPTGLKDVASYPNLVTGLLQRGYSEDDIRKILGENLLRVWKAVEDYAATTSSST
ncbi:MAG: dipeptidase [Gammaproteobacteria bacterium]|nr:dipeptidase [Gammaproteobacteria bacterium]